MSSHHFQPRLGNIELISKNTVMVYCVINYSIIAILADIVTIRWWMWVDIISWYFKVTDIHEPHITHHYIRYWATLIIILLANNTSHGKLFWTCIVVTITNQQSSPTLSHSPTLVISHYTTNTKFHSSLAIRPTLVTIIYTMILTNISQ